MGIPQPFLPGPRLVDGSALNAALASNLSSYTDAITAFAGGGQASAVPLTSAINHITVCASGGDSVMMPVSTPGACVVIVNDGVASATVYANTVSALQSGVEDTLNGTAGATGISVANGKTALLYCFAPGAWAGPVALA